MLAHTLLRCGLATSLLLINAFAAAQTLVHHNETQTEAVQSANIQSNEPPSGKVPDDELQTAIKRAIPLLETASAGSADNRKCFTCHSQALPVFAIVAAKQHGFATNESNLQRQVQHTHAHLKRGQTSYESGKGQGGGVDTAGYALWTLEEGEQSPDDVTNTVVRWILSKQNSSGYWNRSSFRPPSEASSFSTTYLAIRGLLAFGTDESESAIERAIENAGPWLVAAPAQETEDKVFRMLSLSYCDVPDQFAKAAIDDLKQLQNRDGGWAQKPDMESDAYATSTVMYALSELAAVDKHDPIWQRAVRFLLQHQQADGSWFVASRSKPFQTYFETGFPHGKDQFISTTATGWATLALLESIADHQQQPTITGDN